MLGRYRGEWLLPAVCEDDGTERFLTSNPFRWVRVEEERHTTHRRRLVGPLFTRCHRVSTHTSVMWLFAFHSKISVKNGKWKRVKDF